MKNSYKLNVSFYLLAIQHTPGPDGYLHLLHIIPPFPVVVYRGSPKYVTHLYVQNMYSFYLTLNTFMDNF